MSKSLKLNLAIIILLCILAIFALTVPISPPARAETFIPASPMSVSVNALAKVTYHYYTLYSSGVSFAYEIEFSTPISDEIFNTFNLFFSSTRIPYAVEKTDGYTIFALKKFDSFTDYYIAEGVDGYEKDSPPANVKRGFFYNEYINEIYTVFKYMGTSGYEINTIMTILSYYNINADETEFEYVYGTPYKTITSNAGKKSESKTQMIYLHTFTIEDAEQKIIIVQRNPNSAGWYFIAIIISAVVAGSIIVVHLIKRKKRA